MADLPDLLTVEEAAEVIRVGRTKAYAMAREWRATGGRSGLPVIDFGHVLRVPRCQLETLVGGPLNFDNAVAQAPAPTPVPEADSQTAESSPDTPVASALDDDRARERPAAPDPARAPARPSRRRSRRRTPGPDQPSLPFTS